MVYQDVFTKDEISKLFLEFSAWIATQDASDATNACAYVFREEKQGAVTQKLFKPALSLYVYKAKDHASVDRLTEVNAKMTFNINELASQKKALKCLKNVNDKDNKYLLERVLPLLNKHFKIEQTKRVKFLIEE